MSVALAPVGAGELNITTPDLMDFNLQPDL